MQRSQPQRVQIVVLDLVDPGEQGLEVGLLRVGAASRVELVFHPPVDATRR